MTRQSAVGSAASKHSLIPSKNIEITKLEIALKVRTKLALFLRLNVWQENTLGLFQHIQGHLSIEPPYDPMCLQHEIRSMFEVNQWSKLMGILWESCGAQLNRLMWNPWPKSIAPLSQGRWSRNLGALRHQGATALTASTQARQGNLIIKILDNWYFTVIHGHDLFGNGTSLWLIGGFRICVSIPSPGWLRVFSGWDQSTLIGWSI